MVQIPCPRTHQIQKPRSTSESLEPDMSGSDLEQSESDSEFNPGDEKPKRRKTESSIGVVFKFIPEQSEVTCSFPLAEYRTSEELLTKARKFFQVFNKDAGSSILACRSPSQQEQHCLFENSEGQFVLLLTEAAEALMSSNQRLTSQERCSMTLL